MHAFETGKTFSFRTLIALPAILLFGYCIAGADDKKAAAPKPPAPKPAPTRSVPPAGGPRGASTAGRVPASSGHPPAGSTGRTTSNPTGRTTSNPTGRTTGNPTGRTTASPTGSPGTGAKGRSADIAAGREKSGVAKGPDRSAAISRSLPKGHNEFKGEKGDFTRRPDGRVATVRDSRRRMEIHHGLDGNRRVDVRRGDHRIVAERGGRGFVERRYAYHGREYYHRTYYYHGRAYDHYYHGYYYRGAYVHMYTPAYYYAPGFYGWAYNPWGAPFPYAWGWAGNPWYGYYGPYFAPYPVYPSASLWLTDYMISTTLAAAYEERAAAAAQAQAQVQAEGFVALTPQVKDMIAAEVQRQIAIENAEAQAPAQNADPNPSLSGVQAMLTDRQRHVFVAGRGIDVVDATGAECLISEGDVLQLTRPPAEGATSANLVVLSSKGGRECRAGNTVSVEFTDLQDMQNHMRETIDQGMNELHSKQGKGGLPTLPASAGAQPTKAPFAAAPDAPGIDQNAAAEIAQQSKEADQAESEITSQAQPDSGSRPPAPTDPRPSSPSIALPVPFEAMGKSTEEVIRKLGQPTNIMDLGSKKIFRYPDMKVTFKDGKVIDVQ